jgi:RNA polymerase sigma factor (sigma-70 family)
MSHGQLKTAVRHLRRVAGPAVSGDVSDARLLERYASCRDEGAFAALVRRYGRLVRSVCWRVLRHEQDADDAFQATFLVFATKAASIRDSTSVSSWLYGVAFRTAMNAKRARTRRAKEEESVERRAEAGPVSEAALREVQFILDDEVSRLPEKYRAPFVLCCLEGKGRAEAAALLGWKEGTVSGRLARARVELQRRLIRRGVALSAALCATAIAPQADAAVPSLLADRTVRAALAYVGGEAGMVTSPVIALVHGVTDTMFASKCKVVTVLLVLMGLLAGGAGLLVATGGPNGRAAPALAPAGGVGGTGEAKQGEPHRQPAPAGEQLSGTVFNAITGKPFPGAAVVVLRYTPSYQRETKHTSAPDGRFVFDVTPEEAAREDLRLTVRVEAAGFVGMPSRSADDSLVTLRDEKAVGIPPYFDRIELHPTEDIWGRVETPEGKPAAGVQVVACAQPEAAKYLQRVRRSITTDEQGRFRLQVATPGPAFLYLLPEHYAASYQDLKTKRGDLGTLGLQPGTVVKGKLRGLKKEPLADRWVRIEFPFTQDNASLHGVGHGFGRWVKTVKDGEFAFAPLPPGEYVVKVPFRNDHGAPGSGPGFDFLTETTLRGRAVDEVFLPKTVRLAKGGEPEELELRPVPHLLFRVEAADTKGRPKSGVDFTISGSLDGIPWRGYGGTDKDGRSVVKVPHGLRGLGEEGAGITFSGDDEVLIRRAKDASLRELEFYGLQAFLGTLNSDTWLGLVVRKRPQVVVRVGAEDGGALPCLSVSSRIPKYKPTGFVSFKLSETQFRLNKVPIDGSFTVVVVADGYDPVEKQCDKLPEGAKTEVVVTLRKKKQEP